MAYRILEGCPRCGGYPVPLAPARNVLERLREALTGRHPFQCARCGWHGWAHESWDRRQRDLPPPGNLERRKTSTPDDTGRVP